MNHFKLNLIHWLQGFSLTLIRALPSLFVFCSLAQLAFAGSISGRVTNADGTLALANIRVEARRVPSGLGNTVSTDANGQYLINVDAFGAGQYVVRFYDETRTYVEQFFDQAPDVISASNIAVGISGVVTGINARLAESSKIRGYVYGPDNTTPLEFIYVTAFIWNNSIGDWDLAGEAFSDENGLYEMSGLFPGNYRLKFQDLLGTYLSEWHDNQPDLSAANDIEVLIASVEEGINASLGLASKISGTVLEETTANPLSGIVVSAFLWNEGWVSKGLSYTEADGAYSITGLGPGTYRVEFKDENRIFATVYFDAELDVEEASDITVTNGAWVQGVDAEMFPASSIRGLVGDELDSPLPNVTVSAFRSIASDWVLVNSGNTDENGLYEVNGITPGTYRISFDGGFHGFPVIHYHQVLDFDSATDIPVAKTSVVSGINAQLFQPVLNLPPTNIVLSHAVLAENQPSGFTVGSFTAEDPDENESFSFTLVSGEGDDDNHLFAVVDDQLLTAAVINYEAKSNRMIRVRATDAGELFVEKNFVIDLEDVNEIPVMESLDTSITAQIIIRWSSAEYHTYTILEATNLIDGFIVYTQDIPSTPPMNTFTADVPNSPGSRVFMVIADENYP